MAGASTSSLVSSGVLHHKLTGGGTGGHHHHHHSSSAAVVPGGHSPRAMDWNALTVATSNAAANGWNNNSTSNSTSNDGAPASSSSVATPTTTSGTSNRVAAVVAAGGSASTSRGRSSSIQVVASAADEDDLDDEEDEEDDDDEDGANGGGGAGGGGDGDGANTPLEKKKSTRGSRACTVCRKLKMRCVGAENGPPCKRCKNGKHECIFEESQRGRRSNRKTDMMAKSLKKMEATLETVLKSISHPSMLTSSGLMQMSTSDLSAMNRGSGQGATPLDPGSVGAAGASSGDIPTGASPHNFHNSSISSGSPNFGPGGENKPRTTIEWSGIRGDRNGQTRDGSPRLHSLPDNTLNPLGLLAEASLQNTRKRTAVSVADVLEPSYGKEESANEPPAKREKLGMGNPQYFMPGPMNILPVRRIVIEQRGPPAILEEKIVTVEEVVELFAIFFTHCHRSAPFLDADIHTPAATGSRSPFLFTCICTVAARYYTKRKDDLYRKCHRVAMRVAFDVTTKGFKSTEICQGFLLLCNWNQPAERFEEERTYQFSGIAIRMATDLNLHRKTLANLPADVSEESKALYQRELMNRERAWMYTYIADRSISTQMGKPFSIPKEDYLIRNARTWFLQPGAQPSDSGLSAMVEMHRIVGRMLDTLYSDTRSVSGLNPSLDYPLLMRSFLGQLDQWRSDWTEGVSTLPESAYTPDSIRHSMRDFYHSYSYVHSYRLFLLSFAIQHALDNPQSTIDLPSYTVMVFESASIMIGIARDVLEPTGILRYAIDSTFVYLSYAATFLLKLVSPSFTHIIDEESAIRLVRNVAETFERAAIDDTHTPALYASFLRALIDNKLNTGRTAPGSRAATRPSSPAHGAASMGGGIGVGMEAYLKSRANSPGGEGLEGAAGGSEHHSSTNNEHFDSLAMDSMLSNGGFWDNMLMPGFGGPLQGLSGGTGTMLGTMGDHWSVTPMHSRPGSPNPFGHSFPHFDFANPPSSSSGGQGGSASGGQGHQHQEHGAGHGGTGGGTGGGSTAGL
ncbi:BZ3500_MvSof-1268-A1-R1_Chr10-1g02747 [Microbotryum saponariae]|uniref:BZ3500_MvSof-1268-A1-R1_Chr10-1g02747 protein n=1 Tax=Microbotryum saponariae TaxID=289078 RepID=A0A2X0L7B4_9BASI|nr:BZ3500_MvSof-1268-A1-R1_Chr10-1g02747 [Microbotryum saponariae]SDA06236.1 BZ3501_MvSof-1269-A2-R1_Chr10-1g02348 [Microbotryum saponariae]